MSFVIQVFCFVLFCWFCLFVFVFVGIAFYRLPTVISTMRRVMVMVVVGGVVVVAAAVAVVVIVVVTAIDTIQIGSHFLPNRYQLLLGDRGRVEFQACPRLLPLNMSCLELNPGPLDLLSDALPTWTW